MSAKQTELRVTSVTDAVRYGNTLMPGRFSRDIVDTLLRQKKIRAYRHLGRILVDLNSIDRYVKTLPIAEFPPRQSRKEQRG